MTNDLLASLRSASRDAEFLVRLAFGSAHVVAKLNPANA